MSKRVISKNSLYYSVILLVCLLAEPLSTVVAFMSYTDDIVGLWGWCVFLLDILKKNGRFEKEKWNVIKYLVLVIIIGLVSNCFSNLNRTFFDVLLDVSHLIKFMGAYILAEKFIDASSNKQYKKITHKFAKLMILSAFFFYILSFIIDLGMSSSVRFGINDYHFIYDNSGAFSNYCVAYYLMLLSDDKYKNNALFKVLDIILLLATLRFKAFGVVVVIIVFEMSSFMKKGIVLKFVQWIGGALAVIILGWDQFASYYIEDNATPRALLLKYGIKTANDFFPLGSGFGTYGSSVAANHYSPLYVDYGFANTWALGTQGKLLNDNFWPMICGQFGWIGFVVYVIMLVVLFKFLMKKAGDTTRKKNAVVILYANILIASLGGPIMVGIYAVLLFYIMPMVLKEDI